MAEHSFCLHKAHKGVDRRIIKLDQLRVFCCSGEELSGLQEQQHSPVLGHQQEHEYNYLP